MSRRWDTARLGCIQRDGFQVRPFPRTLATQAGGYPLQSRAADSRAPLSVGFNAKQTRTQFANFRQWVAFDLEGGARPFVIDLWLYGAMRRVRARLIGPWNSRRDAFDTWSTSGAFEIERESIGLDFEGAADVSRAAPLAGRSA